MGRAAEKIYEYCIRLEGKEIRHGNRFEYLGGIMTGDSRLEAEVQRRIQVGVIVWRRVEGLMAGKQISHELKGKVLVSCVMPADLYSVEMVTLTEAVGLQEQLSQEDCGSEEGE